MLQCSNSKLINELYWSLTMIDQMNEQLQKAMQPVTELATANAKALEQLASQQQALFSNLINASVSFSSSVADNKDVNSLVAAQKAYADGVQEQVVSAAKDAYEVITAAQTKAGEVMQTAMQESQAAVVEATKSAK
jgi:phasin family protein